MSVDIAGRHARAAEIVADAASTALRFFRDRDALCIETKGAQDWVSEADREVELQIRAALKASFPDDGIVGEEHDNIVGSSGFVWIIDPIDGTTNFLNGLPHWCVVLAGVYDGQVVVGHVNDPNLGEAYAARRDEGATLNGQAMAVAAVTALDQGTVCVGHNARMAPSDTLDLLASLLAAGGLFNGGGSGALDLASVACGRVIGYCESHMFAWDCLASLLLIEEAGGRVQPFDLEAMIASGGRVVTSAPGVYDALVSMTDTAYVS